MLAELQRLLCFSERKRDAALEGTQRGYDGHLTSTTVYARFAASSDSRVCKTEIPTGSHAGRMKRFRGCSAEDAEALRGRFVQISDLRLVPHLKYNIASLQSVLHSQESITVYR